MLLDKENMKERNYKKYFIFILFEFLTTFLYVEKNNIPLSIAQGYAGKGKLFMTLHN